MAKPDPTISLGFLNYSLRTLLPKCARPQKLQSTKNTAVVGAYVESAVRQLVRRQVHPLHVATGAVIDQANIPGDPRLPQLDTIVWMPSPVPAMFQVSDFAFGTTR